MTMKIDWMRGCATALVTPFTPDGAIDEERMRALVERQIAGGVRLLVPCGTTGESATMTEEEDARVIGLTIEVARGRAKVIAGAGSNSTASAIEYSKRFRELGADAVLQVAPWYNKPTQEGLYAHFSAIAESIPDLPIMLYNVPGRTSSNIAAQTTLRLARDCENIVAVKEASGNLSQIMEILRERPAGFSVLSGDDAVTLPLIALGGDGIVSVASNEIPDLMSRMTNLALDGNWKEARRIGRQHNVGRMTFRRARTLERNDIAETGRLGRVNGRARVRRDAGMAGTQLDQLAAVQLPDAGHSPPSLAEICAADIMRRSESSAHP